MAFRHITTKHRRPSCFLIFTVIRITGQAGTNIKITTQNMWKLNEIFSQLISHKAGYTISVAEEVNPGPLANSELHWL